MGFIEWLRKSAPKESVIGKIRDRQDYVSDLYDKYLAEEQAKDRKNAKLDKKKEVKF
jgi:hypothetical protein